jgi:hypothetical protein
VLYYVAAAATAIAGILHLMQVPNMLNFNPNGATLFLVGGLAQVFWVVPMVRRWGKVWYAIGIAGTVAFMAIWAITRMPGNPITGRGGPVNETAMVVEAMEGIFIALATAILVIESRMKRVDKKTASESA